MAALLTDYININRGGTIGDGSTGTYYVTTLADVEAILTKLSGDAGNLIVAGGDGGNFLDKATVEGAVDAATLGYNGVTNILTFTDHNGSATALDLSALSADIYVTGGSIDGAGQLILTDNDGVTPDVTIDLSAYVNAVTDNQAGGTLTLASAGGSTVIQKTAWMSAAVAP